MWNLCFPIMANINLEKFYSDLNKNLVTATNILEGFAWEVNLRKNQ